MRATQILILALLGVPTTAASAGELGATSRGSVSITITVPPHLRVEAASDRSSSANALCITGNGFDHYHVALLETDGRPGKIAIPSALSKALRPGEAYCGSILTKLVPVGDSLADHAADRPGPGPLMLLIVPD